MRKVKDVSDVSADGYIPEGFVVVENFMDIVSLGEEKIKKLIARWVEEENKKRAFIKTIKDKHACDSNLWEYWTCDARWGPDAGSKRSTFLWKNLSPDERALYEKAEKEIYSIETKLSNLQTLLEVAQKLAKSKPRKK